MIEIICCVLLCARHIVCAGTSPSITYGACVHILPCYFCLSPKKFCSVLPYEACSSSGMFLSEKERTLKQGLSKTSHSLLTTVEAGRRYRTTPRTVF